MTEVALDFLSASFLMLSELCIRDVLLASWAVRSRRGKGLAVLFVFLHVLRLEALFADVAILHICVCELP